VEGLADKEGKLPEQKLMVGLHSYDMRENATYRNDFYLDSAHIDADAEAALDRPFDDAASAASPRRRSTPRASPTASLDGSVDSATAAKQRAKEAEVKGQEDAAAIEAAKAGGGAAAAGDAPADGGAVDFV